MRRVAEGETIAITNHGRVVAHLVPATPTDEEITQSLVILDEIEQIAEELRGTWPDGMSAVDIMREERREL